ncbi:cytochrome c oxidase assembly protein, partial [Mycolicibacter hiberniae]|uniref:cytochrome c oxidase assembly protein n=1 Tax=Mycolicibacter hiberniae TaxID=29314 RepID=UPI0021F31519
PWWSTACFLSGCLILGAVMGLSIERYGFRLFSAFMFQQLALSILVPPLLVLGSPGRLLLRSTPHRGPGRWVLAAALAGLRTRAGAFLLHPAVTIPLFLFSYYGLYLSQLFDSIAVTWLGHTALEVFFLLSSQLFDSIAVTWLGHTALEVFFLLS